jgi:plasmid stabilization system protein ParE
MKRLPKLRCDSCSASKQPEVSLPSSPNRGRPRDAIRSGLRSIPLGRTVTIYYEVGANEVQIVRVIHARRDAATAFADE